MYIINGIAYAGELEENIEVEDIKILDDYMMIILFSTGEYRLFDATILFQYPAFEALKDEAVFRNARIEYGVVTWNDGDIDVAPEKMYQDSYAYETFS